MSQRRVLQGRPGPGRRGRGRAGAQPLTCRPRAAARSVRTVPERPDALRTGGGRAVGEAAEHRDAAGRRYGTGRWGRPRGPRSGSGCFSRGRGRIKRFISGSAIRLRSRRAFLL